MIHVFFLWEAFVLFPIWFCLLSCCYIRIILAVVHITYITNILHISVLSLFIMSFSSVQLLGHVWLFAISWTAAHQASLSITNYQILHKLMSIKSVMPSNHLIHCHLLLPPSIFLSIRVFSNESVLCIRWSKYWSFSFSISPSNEYSWSISFRIDWFDLLIVKGTLKSLLQHHSPRALICWCSAFFIVQLSQPYMTTGKTSDSYLSIDSTQLQTLFQHGLGGTWQIHYKIYVKNKDSVIKYNPVKEKWSGLLSNKTVRMLP